MKSSDPKPPFPAQQQHHTPGTTAEMIPQPDHGERLSRLGTPSRQSGDCHRRRQRDRARGRDCICARGRGCADRLSRRRRGRARDRALGRGGGRKAVLMPGDISRPDHCEAIVNKAVEAFGRLDVLVNNAAYQMSYPSLEAISDEEWDKTFDTNIGAMFRITRAAVRQMKAGCLDRQHLVDQCRSSESRPDRLRDNQRRDSELYGRPRAIAGGKGHSRELRRAGTHLDTADSVDHAAGKSREIRRAGSDETPRPACRTGGGLRDAGIGRSQLYFRGDDRCDRRRTDYLRRGNRAGDTQCPWRAACAEPCGPDVAPGRLRRVASAHHPAMTGASGGNKNARPP